MNSPKDISVWVSLILILLTAACNGSSEDDGGSDDQYPDDDDDGYGIDLIDDVGALLFVGGFVSYAPQTPLSLYLITSEEAELLSTPFDYIIDLSFISTNYGWGITDKGTLLEYFNGEWAKFDPAPCNDVEAIELFGIRSGFALCDDGLFAMESNGWITKLSFTADSEGIYLGMHCLDESDCVIWDAHEVSRFDGESVLEILNFGENFYVESVEMQNHDTIYLVAIVGEEEWAVSRYEDGEWVSEDRPLFGSHLSDSPNISRIDNETVVVAWESYYDEPPSSVLLRDGFDYAINTVWPCHSYEFSDSGSGRGYCIAFPEYYGGEIYYVDAKNMSAEKIYDVESSVNVDDVTYDVTSVRISTFDLE
ncbi:MAG: hypothetical protein IT350_19955 [Deltaproteobacteria bacterium]|nr:hypothetical protein [Deltaproteobacteria bacterium]